MKKMVLLYVCMFFSGNSFAECSNLLTPSTPSDQYVDLGDGTVEDTETGLVWVRCSLGQEWENGDCIGEDEEMTWLEALDRAENLSYGGHDDWRLPNIKELSTIVEYSCSFPAINEEIFPNTQSEYIWSSSPTLSGGGSWSVLFSTANTVTAGQNRLQSVKVVRN